MDRPMTRYATTDDRVSIAYQVVGEGPIDLVFVHAFVSHVEVFLGVAGVRALRR